MTIAHLELTPTLTIAAGETLHVRILPWHNLGEVKSGKYICVKNVQIEGLAFDPKAEGIDAINTPIHATKIIRDGKVMIVRDGIRYDVLGNQL